MRQDLGAAYPSGFLRFGKSFTYYKQRRPLFRIYSTRCAYYSWRADSRYFFSFYYSKSFYKLSRFLSSMAGMKFSRTCCENCLILSAFILLQSYFSSFSPWAIFKWVGLLYETRYSSLALLILLQRYRIDSLSLRTSMKVFWWSYISDSDIGRCRFLMSASFFLRYYRMLACFCVKDYYSCQCKDFCRTTLRYSSSCFLEEDSRSSPLLLIFCMFYNILCIFYAFFDYYSFTSAFLRYSYFCSFFNLAASRLVFSSFRNSFSFALNSSRLFGGLVLLGGGETQLGAIFAVLKSQSFIDWIDLLRYSNLFSSSRFSRSAQAIFLAFINLSYCSAAVNLDLLDYFVTSSSPFAILLAYDQLSCRIDGFVTGSIFAALCYSLMRIKQSIRWETIRQR